MRLRGTAEANWKGFLASLFAEPVLSGEILPLHFVQGQNDKGSEGLRASAWNKLHNLLNTLPPRLPRLRCHASLAALARNDTSPFLSLRGA